MSSARLFTLAACIAAGAFLGVFLPIPSVAIPVCATGLVLAAVLRKLALLFLAAALLACTLSALRVSLLLEPVPELGRLTLSGVVVQPPKQIRDETQALVRLDARDGQQLKGRILLAVRSPPWTLGDDIAERPKVFEIGDRIEIAGARIVAFRLDDFQSKIRALRLRAVARAFADYEDVSVTGQGGSLLVRAARTGRSWVRATADRLPSATRGLLLGITIGDISGLPPTVQEDFKRTALTHLVAVSGANVAVVLAAFLLLLRMIRFPVRAIPWALCVVILGFCATAAFEPSVVRASAMAMLVLWALVMGAARQGLNVLAASVVVLLLADPFIAFQLGFQLSVLATFGLLTVAKRIAQGGNGRPLYLAAAATIGAQLSTLPLIAASTGRVSVVGLPANLVTAPLVGPATVIGFAISLLGVVLPPARFLVWVAHPLLAAMLALARSMADLPLAIVDLPSGSVGGLSLVALISLSVFALLRARRQAAFVAALAVLAPTVVAAGSLAARPQALEGLSITMLDVGQGESILISNDGHNLLIDGGPDEGFVSSQLRDWGIYRLDYLMMSHAHDDHVSGLPAVAQRSSIGMILDPGLESNLPEHHQLKEFSMSGNVPWQVARRGQVFWLGSAKVEILWPAEPLMTSTESDLNENSIVFRVDYGASSLLYAGETQDLAQSALVDLGVRQLDADVLKVSHHGSARMDPDFYAATGADVALIPVGYNNYGHPSPITLAALEDQRVLRSDLHGTVTVTLDRSGSIAVKPRSE